MLMDPLLMRSILHRAHRAATSLLSALKEEETATATRAAARKQLVQS